MLNNGNRRYQYLVLGHTEAYFGIEHSDSKNKYSEDARVSGRQPFRGVGWKEFPVYI